MAHETKVKGLTSYFPPIEETYGKPIAHWMQLHDGSPTMAHLEQVLTPKSEHGLGLGHGHANALTACHRARAAGGTR